MSSTPEYNQPEPSFNTNPGDGPAISPAKTNPNSASNNNYDYGRVEISPATAESGKANRYGMADAGQDAAEPANPGWNDQFPDDPNSPEAKSQKFGTIFTNRNFMLLWVAQALSQTAQNTLNLALVNYVFLLSGGSPTQTALATVAFVLPGVFFSALAGAFVDRLDKRLILVITNGLRAVLIPWLYFMEKIDPLIALPLIFLITCLFSTFSQFFAPAEGALIPFLVEGKQLTQANSLFQVTLFVSQFVGFSLLAPLLPQVIGNQALFLVIAAIYVLCIFLTWFLPAHLEKDRPKPVGGTRSVITGLWSEIKDGWKFIRSEHVIWLSIIYLSTVQSVLFTMTAIGIPYVSKRNGGLGQPQSDIIYVLAPISVGLGLGVFMVNKLVSNRSRGRLMVWATVGMGVCLIAVGLLKPVADLWVKIFTPGVPLGGPGITLTLIGLSIPFGFTIGLLNIPALTLLQERSPKEIVGRVFAAYFTFANLVSIFPILFAGTMGDLIGLTPTFIIIGLVVIGIGYYGHVSRNKDQFNKPISLI